MALTAATEVVQAQMAVEAWAGLFETVDHVRGAVRHLQDLVLLRKT